jgi:hypothetical protein
MKKFVLILFSTLLLTNCKKHSKNADEPLAEPTPDAAVKYDTVKPGSYFPAYPGSYWKYLENNTLTVTYSTSPNWVLDSYRDTRGPEPSPRHQSTPKYVTLFQGGHYEGTIYGYTRLLYWNNSFGDYFTLCPFLSETSGAVVGVCTVCDTRYGQPCLAEYEKIVGKFVNSNNDSILITKGGIGFISPNPNGYRNPDSALIIYKEYTKGIGFSRQYNYDTIKHDTTYRIRLLEYKIGKH